MKMNRIKYILLVGLSLLASTVDVLASDSLRAGFTNPPASAKVRTWWHWLNGNISKEGITADLEAMQRVGIQEAQIFNGDMGYPEGPVTYLSPEWLELFKFAVQEAQRLGLEIGFHNGAGWSASGGPWVTPEYAMQTVVYSEVQHKGENRFKGKLPLPPTRLNYYKDIAVLAFPKPQQETKIDDLALKSLSGHSFRNHLEPDTKEIPQTALVDKNRILNLTSKLASDGTLEWDAPKGDWIILRLGHTPNGTENHPAVIGGRGLECDKMSRAAVDVYWQGGIKPILDKLGSLAGTTLVNCIIDSYEVGCNNWTSGFRDAFKRLRGYDCLSYLPALAGYYVDSGEITERFLWDFRRTIGDLMAENYYGYFRELCHQNRLKLSIEPYGGPFECLQVGAMGDIVMSEFWSGENIFFDSPKFVASAAHINGKPFVGAESFTNLGGWSDHPASLKPIGDRAWTEGINRLIFHTYVHQPWNAAPGMTLGTYGFDFNRLNTWWEQSTAFLNYLSRSQFLLQQGRYAADMLVFAGESSPNDAILKPEIRESGYDYDLIGTPNMASLTVKDGLICTPAGGKYRIMVLPETKWITPELLQKIGELAKAGATIIGPKPQRSPSLCGYPQCDEQVARLADELWENHWITDCSIREILDKKGLVPDCSAKVTGKAFSFVHRITDDADIYLIVNSQKVGCLDTCHFRISGKQPEIWNPLTGEIKDAAVWQSHANGTTTVPIPFDPEGSLFVVFRKPATGHIVRTKTELLPQPITPLPELKIIKAEYGTFFPNGLVDVTEALNKQIRQGQIHVSAGNHLASCDPAPGSIKELRVEYKIGNQHKQASILENEPFAVKANPAEELKVIKAAYGKFDRRLKSIPVYTPASDVTAYLSSLIANGQYIIPVDDALTGDNSGSVKEPGKELRLTYEAKGEIRELTVPQGQELKLIESTPAPKLVWEEGKPVWITPSPGKLIYTTSTGKEKQIEVNSVPEPIKLAGNWEILFTSKLDTPFHATFERLMSWTKVPDERIRYFSGTAAYRKQFFVSAALIRQARLLELDLGDVGVMAEVFVNGKGLGVTWKAPYRMDISQAVKEGMNEIEIRVTNLWPNRLIGDERYPDNRSYPPKHWPDWLLNGSKAPSQHATFATWKHWDKDSPLQTSGLLGPVLIRPYVSGKVSK